MKNEEYRHVVPQSAVTPLPKSDARPCMRGVLDLELYNRTGEIVMIEPLQEYVSPVDPMAATPINPNVKRKGMSVLNPNKPSREKLEIHLRAGAPIANIAKKYDCSVATVHNWIKAYGLQGIQGVKKPDVEDKVPVEKAVTPQAEQMSETEMVQASPSLNEIEQFHTDTELQEPPKVEMDVPINIPEANEDEIALMFAKTESTVELQDDPAPQTDKLEPSVNACEPFAEVWQDIHDDLVILERQYVEQAKVSFRDRLREMLADVLG